MPQKILTISMVLWRELAGLDELAEVVGLLGEHLLEGTSVVVVIIVPAVKVG